MTKLTRTFLSLGGLGYIRPASGTVASVVTAILWWLVFGYWSASVWLQLGVVILVGVVAYCLALVALKKAFPQGDYDQSWVVVDEFIGMLIACLPSLFLPRAWENVVLALILFRLFDIWKPWGIRWLDKQQYPSAVMLDDMLAGVYSAVILTLLVIWLI